MYQHDTHLQRNCCAALSNLSSSSGYFSQLVECLGIERLFASLNLSAIHPNSQIEPLAEQALFIIDIDWTKIRMSSLHIASKKGLVGSVFKTMNAMKRNNLPLSVPDSKGNIPLHYAVEHCHDRIATLLVSRGSDIEIRNNAGQSPLDLVKEDDESMHRAIDRGLDLLKNARVAFNDMVCGIKICSGSARDEGRGDSGRGEQSDDENPIVLPRSLITIIVEYIDPWDVLDHFGDDDYSRKNLNKNKRSNECLTSYHVRDNEDVNEQEQKE